MGNVISKKWKFIGAWPGISLNNSMIWQGPEAIQLFYEEFGIWRGLAHVFIGQGRTAIMEEYITETLREDIVSWLNKEMKENPQRIISTIEKYYDYVPIYKKEAKTLYIENPETLTNEELAFKFTSLRYLQSKVTIYDQFGMYSEAFFESEVESILLRKNLDADKALEMQNVLTAPRTLSSLQQERYAIIKTLKNLLSKNGGNNSLVLGSTRDIRLWLGSNARQELEDLVIDFGWIPVFLNNPSWGEDHFIREVLDLISELKLTFLDASTVVNWSETLQKQLEELDDLPESNRKKADNVIEKLQLNDYEINLFKAYGLSMNTRNECEYQLGFGSIYVQKLIPVICKRLKIDEDTFHCLYTDEVSRLLLKIISLDDIPISRLIMSGNWYVDEKKLTLMSFAEAEAFRVLNRKEVTIESEIENSGGIGVSRGEVEGPVCIIRGIEDFSKFQKGDILVAECTTADYVSLMRLARGIITEHGGRTCHAAIISRELEIPAIVGYKSALSLFKDGQKIRFNASEGVAYPIE
jgi:phosphoenolpyruvate synthase/pyruvate phosphate dikinase